LLSIQYDKSWSLFGRNSFIGYAQFQADGVGRSIHSISISSFPFYSPDEMVSFLQNILIKFVSSSFITVSYDQHPNRISFVMGKERGMLFLSDDLRKAMGFKLPVVMYKTRRDGLRSKVIGQFAPRVDFVDELRILSNVVAPRMLNDQMQPLLRNLQPKKSVQTTGYEEVNHPIYLPALPINGNTIDIRITDAKGKTIEFGHGKVSIDLHFKRVSNLNQPQRAIGGLSNEMSFGGYHICLTSNEKGEFDTELYQVLRLNSDKHEIALVDASYDVSWNNVDSGSINLQTSEGEFELSISKGRYKNIEELVDEINTALEKRTESIKDLRIFYNSQTNTVRIRWFGLGSSEIRLSEDLSQIFGLNKHHVLNRSVDSLRTPDINRGMTSLFVYSNLVANRLVGNASVPLLRTIPLYNNRYQTVRHEFRCLYYIPTNTFEGRIVNVKVTRDNGHVVNFPGGKLVLNIHIREKVA
jgi:hypothetical protein